MKVPKVGDKFERWTVLGVAEITPKHGAKMRCRCTCGKEAAVYEQALLRGSSKSCGCLRGERLREIHTLHGDSKSGERAPEYRVWDAMKQRCLNPKTRQYKDYGGRGITIYAPWLKYENFIQDMGRRPSPEHTLERKDNSKGYSKENCTWATRMEQQQNTRRPKTTVGGEAHSLAEWARKLGVPSGTLYAYAHKLGPQEAILRLKRRNENACHKETS